MVCSARADRAEGAEALEPDARSAFIARVWEHYDRNARDLPWRRTTDPYRVLVSEVMLQQTQVSRVLEPYEAFVAAFPTVESLAQAPLADVLRLWQGLGYNRRAIALKRAAETIVADHQGQVPDTLEGLTALPGVGHATAAQVLAFAFDVGVPFIETNVRTVYLHEFFPDAEQVPDAALLPLVAETIDHSRPREWFWALMDYGTYLKATNANPSRRSRHHVKQAAFEGSNRQLRGRLLAVLTQRVGRAEAAGAGTGDGAAVPGACEGMTATELVAEVRFGPERVTAALEALQSEGFVSETDGRWRIA